jgi:hypothetical protein
VAQPVLGRVEDVGRADGLDQTGWQRLRRGQLEPFELGRQRPGLQLPDPLAQRRQRLAVELGCDRRIAPSPPLRVPPGGQGSALSIPSSAWSRILP